MYMCITVKPYMYMYIICHTCDVSIMYIAAAVVGSVWFHAMLSLAGQMVDELAILWLILTVMLILCPRFMPNVGYVHVHV